MLLGNGKKYIQNQRYDARRRVQALCRVWACAIVPASKPCEEARFIRQSPCVVPPTSMAKTQRVVRGVQTRVQRRRGRRRGVRRASCPECPGVRAWCGIYMRAQQEEFGAREVGGRQAEGAGAGVPRPAEETVSMMRRQVRGNSPTHEAHRQHVPTESASASRCARGREGESRRMRRERGRERYRRGERGVVV